MNDILLGLRVRGPQLASDVANALAGAGPAAAAAGDEISKKFSAGVEAGLKQTERRVRDLFKNATITDTGGIDLNVPGLQASAQAAELNAQKLRVLAEAMERAQGEANQLSNAQKQVIASGYRQAEQAERTAAALRAQADAADLLQNELGQVAGAQRAAAGASNAQKAGLQQVGFQLQDFFVQVAGGTSVVRAFSLQAPQMFGALALIADNSTKATGATAGLLRLLGGPFGIALGVAIPIAGILAEKIFNIGAEADETKDKVDALRKSLGDLTNSKGRPDLGEYGKRRMQVETNAVDLRRVNEQLAAENKKLDPRQIALASGYNPDAAEAYVKRVSATISGLEARKAQLIKDSTEIRRTLDVVDRQMAARQRGQDAAEAERLAAEQAAKDKTAGRAASRADAKLTREAAKDQRDQAKEAERNRDAEEQLGKSLSENLRSLRDATGLAQIRAELGDAAADRAEAELRVLRQYPELVAARVGQTIEYRGAQILVTAELLDQLALLRDLTVAEADRASAAKGISAGGRKAGGFIAGGAKDIARDALEQERRDLEILASDFEDLFGNGVEGIWRKFEQDGRRTLSKLAADNLLDLADSLGVGRDTLKKISGNASLGAAAGGGLGGAAGGALGGAVGEKVLTKGFEKIASGLGSFAGPIGSIVGGILGGVVGSLFKKAPSATTVINNIGSPSAVTGNDKAAQAAVSGISVDVQSSLARIIEQLGGSPGDFNVSIGKYKDDYRVKSDGSPTAGNKHPGDANLIYNGPDAAEALRIAILDAIQDGAVDGISATIRKLITNNADIDLGISKATRLQQAFKDLQALEDPIGAALDQVNLKFEQLIRIAKEAGATDVEMDKLETLYKREREAAIKSAGQSAESLKAFVQGLKAGGDSPLSLRDQEANAKKALQPFIDDFRAGKSIDTDKFQSSLQTVLDIERQINGSSKAYFDQFNQYVSLSEQIISSMEAKAAAGAGANDNPFDAAIAKSSQAAADILEQQSQQIQEQTELLRQIADTMAGRGSDDWLGQTRAYA